MNAKPDREFDYEMAAAYGEAPGVGVRWPLPPDRNPAAPIESLMAEMFDPAQERVVCVEYVVRLWVGPKKTERHS